MVKNYIIRNGDSLTKYRACYIFIDNMIVISYNDPQHQTPIKPHLQVIYFKAHNWASDNCTQGRYTHADG